MRKISAYLKDLFKYFHLKKRANYYLSPIKSYWLSKMTPSWSLRFSRLSKNGYNGPISSPKNTSKHLIFGPNLIFYHREELEIANSFDKWAKNREMHILNNFPSNKTVRNRPRPWAATNGRLWHFLRSLAILFSEPKLVQRPPKGQEMVWLPEKNQSGPRLHLNVHFFTCLCYQQP